MSGLTDDRRADRELVAQWMMNNGYATGHGDTISDLLDELTWQHREYIEKIKASQRVKMTLGEFTNAIRVLWNIDARQYLDCVNAEDREHFGDQYIWDRFRDAPHSTFISLPDQDQERVFSIIKERLK